MEELVGCAHAVRVNEVEPKAMIADGSAKRLVVSGTEVDASRDSFILVEGTATCTAETSSIGGSSVSVVVGDSSASEIALDVSVNGGTIGGSSFKLCARHGDETEYLFFELSGDGDVTVMDVSSVLPTVVPVQAGGALDEVFTLDGIGLSGDVVVTFVAVGEVCSGTSVTSPANAPTATFNAMSGTQAVYDLDTSSADAGTYAVCVRPDNVDTWYGSAGGVSVTVGECDDS